MCLARRNLIWALKGNMNADSEPLLNSNYSSNMSSTQITISILWWHTAIELVTMKDEVFTTSSRKIVMTTLTKLICQEKQICLIFRRIFLRVEVLYRKNKSVFVPLNEFCVMFIFNVHSICFIAFSKFNQVLLLQHINTHFNGYYLIYTCNFLI